MDVVVPEPEASAARVTHARWVRVSHWIVAASLLTLAATGVVILMAHPRLYWGEVGNELMPALLELPISRNYRHGGWENRRPFFQDSASPITANRTYDIFNQNGWARSLHFLSAWLLVIPGVVYLLTGFARGHFRAHMWPRAVDLAPRRVWQDVVSHLRFRVPQATGGPQYGPLQKCAYSAVVFIAFPLSILTGLTMSPAITAAFPLLLTLFGGHQSARTLHFFAFIALGLFVIAHVVMVIVTGFGRQMRGMIFGR